MPAPNPQHPEWGNGYAPRELASIFYSEGWIDVVVLHQAVWVCLLESNGYEQRTNRNADGSLDRGAWMINDHAHPDIPDSVAFNIVASTHAARSIWLANGHTFAGTWHAYDRAKTVITSGADGDAGAVKMCLYAADGIGGNFIKARYGLLG